MTVKHRFRVGERDIENQIFASFESLRIQDQVLRDWFAAVLKARVHETRGAVVERATELQRQLALIRGQQDRLLNMRLAADK
jgi:hypothetical protein